MDLPEKHESLPALVQSIENSGEEGEQELTPLEYVRHHGLSRNYLEDTFALDHLNALCARLEGNVADGSHLPPLDFGRLPRLEERLTLSKEAAIILSEFGKQDTREDIEALVAPWLDAQVSKHLRVELPLLKSHHAADCRIFTQRDGFETNLEDISLPLELVDEENNEGIRFPTKYWELGPAIVKNLKKEKIEVSRDAIALLAQAHETQWTADDENELCAREQGYNKNHALEPVTPLLLPLSPPRQKLEPAESDPAFQLEPFSSPDDLFKEDLDALEKSILAQDVPTPIKESKLAEPKSGDPFPSNGNAKLEDLYLPFIQTDTPPPPAAEGWKAEDYKVEELITPPDPSSGPKKLRWNDNVEILNPSVSPVNSDEIKETLRNNFGTALEELTHRSEQETLKSADNIARVDVPHMPIVKPEPPWEKYQQCHSPRKLLLVQKGMIRNIVGANLQLWKYNRGFISDPDLKWNPFPLSVAKVDVSELFPSDDRTWEGFLDMDRQGMTSSSDLTWRPDGLRILKVDDDEDDEIEPGEFLKDIPLQDISSLARKRKMQLDQDNREMAEVNLQLQEIRKATPAGCLKRKNSTNDITTANQRFQVDGPAEPSILLGGAFSAVDMIGNFLELRGAKKPKLMDSSHFAKNRNNEAAQGQVKRPAGIVQKHAMQLPIQQSPTLKSPIPKQAPLPAPPFKPTEAQIDIIISTTLLKHRGLVKYLETSIPKLRLVERDFQAHNTSTWLPGTVTRSPVTSPLDSEADLIISPSTGILLTTLQKIKQKLLPGQKGKTPIQDRLTNVSFRYDKLIVLVTEGQRDEITNGLDPTDCVALCEFTAFGLSLPSNIIINFIAGGEETLAKWIASSVSQNRVEARLLEDETYWELFLRRAGMNSFAAQQTVAELKVPGGADVNSPNKAGLYGLTAFVEMGKEERIARFGSVCGIRVLERVSGVIDGAWE